MTRSLKHRSSAGSLPLHRQLSERVARDIRAGKLTDGTRLKPERQMASDWGISVGTLRQALGHLEKLGMIERIHGSGNYVRFSGRNSQVNNIYSLFHLELIDGGGLPTAEILETKRTKKPSWLPDIGSSETGFRIRRIRRLDDLPATVEEIWLDGERAKSLRHDQMSEALYKLYADKLGFQIQEVKDWVYAAALPEWRPAGFGPDLPMWSLVERVSYDQNNLPAEYSMNWFNPETTRYVATWGTGNA